MKVQNSSTLISTRILDQCIAKDRAAQRELYDSLLPYLASVCKRYLKNSSDLEDALQESFVNIFNHIEQFDSGKGAFKTWAVKIAINCSLKLNKKMYKINTTEIENGSEQGMIGPSIYSEMNNEEMISFLRKMPSSWFEVFNLYVVEGFSHKEIAELLRIDKALSRQRLSRARSWINEQHATDTGNVAMRNFV